MEQIKVLVNFDHPKVKPIAFKRNGRTYKVDRVNLVYHEQSGAQTIFYFYVSDHANSYKLRFEPETLEWFLVED